MSDIEAFWVIDSNWLKGEKPRYLNFVDNIVWKFPQFNFQKNEQNLNKIWKKMLIKNLKQQLKKKLKKQLKNKIEKKKEKKRNKHQNWKKEGKKMKSFQILNSRKIFLDKEIPGKKLGK